jgi:hypothetical protein
MAEDTVTTTPEQQAQETAAAFEAQFSDTTAAETPAPIVETPAPEQVIETPAPVAEDPWKDVAPVLKETLENISSRLGEVDKLGHRFSSFEGRLGAVQNALAAAQAAKAQGDSAPNQQQIAAAAVSTEKWNKIKEDFPEWAEALDERLAAIPAASASQAPAVDADAIARTATEKAAAQFEPHLRQLSEKLAKAEARELNRAHPDLKQTVKTPEFQTWWNAQPADRRAAADTDADTAIEMIGAYKQQREAAEAQKRSNKQRLESAVTPKGSSHAERVPPNDRAAAEEAFEAQFK